MYADTAGRFYHFLVTLHPFIGCSGGNMPCLHAQILQAFLHVDSNRTTTTPKPNNDIRAETTVIDVNRQPE